MSRVYSERIFLFGGSGTSLDWHVPAGYRCVFRSITVYNAGAGSDGVALWIGPIVIASLNPAATSGASLDLRAVAYAGEVTSCSWWGSLTGQVTAYVFEDSAGRQFERAVRSDREQLLPAGGGL